MAQGRASLQDDAMQAPDFRPLYNQVKDILVQWIIDGRWAPGEALPSEGRLAQELGVSQGTVRKALDEMAAHRLVVRRQGRGTFVAKHTRQQSLFHFFHIVDKAGQKELPTSRILELRPDRATAEQASRLALPPRSKVIVMTRLRFLAGKPVILERITLPGTPFSQLALPLGEELVDELYVLYQEELGVSVAHASERLRAVKADATTAEMLGLDEGAPLLEIERLALDLEGKPVEWRVSLCDTTLHHYFVEID